jgi:hypothetical protein
MKWYKNNSLITALFVSLAIGLTGPTFAMSATSPALGTAATFGILGSTYTNTAAGTVNGDVGYTTPPSVAPTVNGITHVADGTYNQAGIDQGSALSTLNAQTCNFTFGSDTDLSLLPQPLASGVYCVTGAQSIGTGGITLNGAGTYIFRSTGALNTVANSNITLSNGATACDVFWTPGGATTLGANSSFVGTDIDDSGITVGSTVTWNGRALAFATTVTTNADIISVPVCSAPVVVVPTPTPAPTSTPAPVVTPTPIVAPVVSPTITPTPVPTVAPVKLPKTGLVPEETNNASWQIIIPIGILVVLSSIYLVSKKHTS